MNDLYAVLFSRGDQWVGIKLRTDGVDHPARWESKPLRDPLQMMEFVRVVCEENRT